MKAENDDIRVCGGDYDSALHSDCNECFARCNYRKDSKPALWWLLGITIFSLALFLGLGFLLF